MTPLDQLVLLPQPRRITSRPGVCAADTVPRETRDDSIPPQGYRLNLAKEGIHVASSDAAGAHYAAMTLRQLRRVAGKTLPCGVIEDWPDFAVRGFMLDISRDRVPTMATLYRLVDELAEWKFNHLELYTEHTFAYRGHPDVWRDADPLTAEQIRALDVYCRKHFIELVPNQNSFGHLARWLKHPRYRDLAETPDGHTAWGQWRPYPFSLNPLDPRSIALVTELYDELLPNFTSRKFNVGCDETVDLGQGRSKEACEQRGKGRVYLEFLQKIHALVRDRGHTMHFWADIVLNHPELLPELPRDAVALVWGYEADHPFDAQCAAVRGSGLPFYVCPGTSTWNALVGRTDEMIGNIRSAARSGREHGAAGFLVTDWGDNGHWQTWPFMYPGLAWAAGCAWNEATNDQARLAQRLDLHVFQDAKQIAGALVLALGRLYLHFAGRKANSTPIFHLLHRKDVASDLQGTTRDEWEKVARDLERLAEEPERMNLRRDDAEDLRREIELGMRMVNHACQRALGADREPDLAPLMAAMRTCWLVRSRPGGLEDSLAPLANRMA